MRLSLTDEQSTGRLNARKRCANRATPGAAFSGAAQAEMTATRGTKDMLHESNSSHEKAEPLIYQIRIKGYLDRKWADWFAGLSITSLAHGETLLTGPVLDQAMLHGLLRKVRDVGLPLIAVMQVEPEQAEVPDAKP
jgi:hypothetical protein